MNKPRLRSSASCINVPNSSWDLNAVSQKLKPEAHSRAPLRSQIFGLVGVCVYLFGAGVGKEPQEGISKRANLNKLRLPMLQGDNGWKSVWENIFLNMNFRRKYPEMTLYLGSIFSVTETFPVLREDWGKKKIPGYRVNGL